MDKRLLEQARERGTIRNREMHKGRHQGHMYGGGDGMQAQEDAVNQAAARAQTSSSPRPREKWRIPSMSFSAATANAAATKPTIL